MSNVLFTRDINNAICTIAVELEKANRLKKAELVLKYGEKMVDDAINNPYI